jgi:hypothetical protein
MANSLDSGASLFDVNEAMTLDGIQLSTDMVSLFFVNLR